MNGPLPRRRSPLTAPPVLSMRSVRSALSALLAFSTLSVLGAGATGAIGCATSGGSTFDDGGSSDASARRPPDASDGGADARLMLVDGKGGGETKCAGLECRQTCATTSISGKVYDPAGVNPLYDVFVYVPNAPLDPIAAGPVCTSCLAPASGQPIASATTAADGTFTITGAPDGANVPVVLQLGKWRRSLTLPKVDRCKDNTAPDGFFRLPRKQGETSPDDNIPLIALTTGCDGAECFLQGRVGIDLGEFTGPTGTGRVHVYKSAHDDGQTFPGGAGDADTLFQTKSEMMRYDIVFDACECETYDRGGAGASNVGYKNFLDYLESGGRAFTTHFFYNLFASETQCHGDVSCQGQGKLPSVGLWETNQGLAFAPSADCPNDGTLRSASGGPGSCTTIDTAIPKGVAFGDWYAANNTKLRVGGGEKRGYAGLTDLRDDIGELDPGLVAAGTATPWLYAGDLSTGYDAYYVSVNTPVGDDPTKQCGRAIFSDVHVSGTGGAKQGTMVPTGAAFPSYCASDPNASSHAPNELALEFLFFDLSSCVQDDTQPPGGPPPK